LRPILREYRFELLANGVKTAVGLDGSSQQQQSFNVLVEEGHHREVRFVGHRFAYRFLIFVKICQKI
jgi:hypothetical protein